MVLITYKHERFALDANYNELAFRRSIVKSKVVYVKHRACNNL